MSLTSNSILEIEALQGLHGLAACADRLDFNFGLAAHSVEECLPLLNLARSNPSSQSSTLPSCGIIRNIPLKLDTTIFPQVIFFLLVFNFLTQIKLVMNPPLIVSVSKTCVIKKKKNHVAICRSGAFPRDSPVQSSSTRRLRFEF